MSKDVNSIAAGKLITTSRLDLMAKYTYVESQVTGEGRDWAEELYIKHIEAFSGGSFQEPGNPQKNSAEAYKNTFDNLIENISKVGFDNKCSVIPVSTEGMILDGAHRTAICAYFDMDVTVKHEEREVCYDYSFFKNMHLDQKYLDFMVSKYVEINGKNCYVICLWPKAVKNKELLGKADKLIKEKCVAPILAQKDINITYQGLRNFMLQAYANYNWCGTPENGFKGVEGKLDPCYDPCNLMRTYIVELPSVEEMLSLKKEVRELFGLGNHSIHSSDNYAETLMLTHLLFNQNSIHLMNYGKFDYDGLCVRRIYNFKQEIEDAGLNIDRFIVDSSSIMGLYGIRKVRDLDYLTIDANYHEKGIEHHEKDIDHHEKGSEYHEKSVDDLILNPNNYVYAFGMKFITLSVLKDFKANRGEEKDQEDIKLISEKLNNSYSIKQSIECSIIKFKRYARNVKTNFRKFLEKHNIHVFTKIWHWLNGKGYK